MQTVLTQKMKTSHVLFLKTLVIWTLEMRARYNCCPGHSIAAFGRVIEMTEMGTTIIDSQLTGALTEDEFCKSLDACTQEMNNELKVLKKAEQVETAKEPFVLQKEARA